MKRSLRQELWQEKFDSLLACCSPLLLVLCAGFDSKFLRSEVDGASQFAGDTIIFTSARQERREIHARHFGARTSPRLRDPGHHATGGVLGKNKFCANCVLFS
jgi:hypothetical protein